MMLTLLLAAEMSSAMPDGFVHLRDVAPTIVQDMRYAGAHNFTGAPVDGYEAATCILTRQAAEALSKAQSRVEAEGFTLIVWDCYRPARAVAAFMTWVADSDETTRPEFYPRVPKADLVARGYIAARSAHSAGSTLDLGLAPKGTTVAPQWSAAQGYADCTAPKGTRFEDGGVDMGTGFDCFDERAHGDAAGLPGEAIRNRAILRTAMTAEGFKPYAGEWWHFTLTAQPFAGQTFDFPVR